MVLLQACPAPKHSALAHTAVFKALSPSWRTDKALEKKNNLNIFNAVLARRSFLVAFRKTRGTQLLTNNGDAALSSYFYHFVHQGFGSSGELVPLKDTNRTIPHDLLGPSHNFNKLLHTFRAAVQALRQRREAIDPLPAGARLTSPQPSWDPQKLPPRPPDMKQEFLWIPRSRRICQQLLQQGGVCCGIYLPSTSK